MGSAYLEKILCELCHIILASSFWLKVILRLNTQFRGVALCIPGKGDTIGFWDDFINGKIYSDYYTNLFQFAINPKACLWNLKSSSNLLECFKIPMTRPAYNEFLDLQIELLSLSSSEDDANDVWTFIWGQHNYSSHKYYLFQFQNVFPEKSAVWIWKSKCVPKIKFFGWLLLIDKIKTRNLLRRRKKVLQDGYHCVMCHEGTEETAEYLFVHCTSAACRWFSIDIVWDGRSNIHQNLYMAKDNFCKPFFMEIFLIGAWCLCKEKKYSYF